MLNCGAWTLSYLAIALLAASPAGAKDAFTTTGDIGRFAIPAAGAALALFTDDREGLKQFFTSGAATLGVTYGLKYTVNETRPDGGAYSFPSGHTSSAFLGSAYIHHRYGWRWGIPAELAAAAVAYSRVKANRHHWHDVLASAGIAHLSAYLLVDRRDTNVVLMPMVSGPRRTWGIQAAMRF